jgi:cytochrome P450
MDLSLTLILFCILTLIILYKFLNVFLFKPYSIDRSLRLQDIPGDYIPFIGQILQLRRAIRQNRLLQYSLDRHQQYGSYYRSQLGPMARLVICDPTLITYIVKKNVKSYHRTSLARDFLGRLLGMKNLLMSEGEVHSTQRKLMQPVFQHQNLFSMENLMVETTSILLDKWKTLIADQENKSINLEIRKEMSTLTLDIVTGCVFGTGLINDQVAHDTIHRSIASAQNEMEHRFFSLIGILPVIKELPLRSKLNIDKARQSINVIVEKIVDDRRQGVTQSACKGK